MKSFKTRWQITHNWQLIFPFIGILSLLFSSYLLSLAILSKFGVSNNYIIITILTIVLTYLLLHLTLKIFNKLEPKWQVTYRWELITIFIVFAITGSSAARLSDPVMEFISFSKGNTNPLLYWFLRILILFPVYQALLLLFGWLFGQFKFFWSFEKKMLRKLGFARFFKEK